MSLLSLLEHPKDQAQKLNRRTFMKNLGLAGAVAATAAASQAVCAPTFGLKAEPIIGAWPRPGPEGFLFSRRCRAFRQRG